MVGVSPLHAVCLACVASVAGASTAPLLVTDYLPSRFREAQEATRVDLSGIDSLGSAVDLGHTGYFTLDKQLGKNTFFWYSPARDGNADAPLLLWLQGGPGASSLFGLFTEVGPVSIGAGGVIEKRNVTWNQHYHMLFFDNPVGTGFSYTDSVAGFARGYEQYGPDLYNALRQFFQLFPKLRDNDFYVTGESYGGKYVTACAYEVHKQNSVVPPAERMNLKGISIGDGAMDPAAQFKGFPDLLYNTGMVDNVERSKFQEYQNTYEAKIAAHDYVGAFEAFDEMLNGDFYHYGTYYANVTGMGSNYFNFELSPDATPLGGDFVAWLNTPAVRERIHVGDRVYAPENQTCESYLKGDWMRDVNFMLVPLLENYKVLIYSGQNDIILGPSPTESFLLGLQWSGKEAYASARKIVWRRSSKGPGSNLPDVAGYVRQAGNLTQAVVRGAGHMVPGDQPERALDLLSRFIAGKPYTELLSSVSSPTPVVLVV